MHNMPIGAATAAARDKYYVYRPFLNLVGASKGTDKGRVYNETLGYGIMLDGKVTKGKGPIIDLVSMTFDQVEAWIASQDRAVQIAYANSGAFVRSEPTMQTGFVALGITSEQTDAFFTAASQL